MNFKKGHRKHLLSPIIVIFIYFMVGFSLVLTIVFAVYSFILAFAKEPNCIDLSSISSSLVGLAGVLIQALLLVRYYTLAKKERVRQTIDLYDTNINLLTTAKYFVEIYNSIIESSENNKDIDKSISDDKDNLKYIFVLSLCKYNLIDYDSNKKFEEISKDINKILEKIIISKNKLDYWENSGLVDELLFKKMFADYKSIFMTIEKIKELF